MSNAAKPNAGDLAIAAAIAGTATNAQFCKALWSTRGAYSVNLPGYPFPVEVTKSGMVNILRTLPQDSHAGLTLAPRIKGTAPGKCVDWQLIPGTAKAKGKPAKGTAPGPAAEQPAPAAPGTDDAEQPAAEQPA
jgi:hypothetical protein